MPNYHITNPKAMLPALPGMPGRFHCRLKAESAIIVTSFSSFLDRNYIIMRPR